MSRILLRMGQLAHLLKKWAQTRVLTETCTGLQLKQELLGLIEAHGYVAAFPPLMACRQTIVHFTPTASEPLELSLPLVLDIGLMCPHTGLMVDTALRIGPLDAVEQCARQLHNKLHLYAFSTYGEVSSFIHQFVEAHGFYADRKFSGHGIEPFALHSGRSVGVSRHCRRDSTRLKPGDVFTVEPLIFTEPTTLLMRTGNVRIIGPGTIPYAVTTERRETEAQQEVYVSQPVPFAQCEHSYLVGTQGELIRLT